MHCLLPFLQLRKMLSHFQTVALIHQHTIPGENFKLRWIVALEKDRLTSLDHTADCNNSNTEAGKCRFD